MPKNTQNRWVFKPNGDKKTVNLMQNELGIPNTVANLLVQRGITDFESAKHFFRPDLRQLHDPFQMKDMQKAVDRINLALKNEEPILVYGDYDVDGTSAVSLVYTYLSKLTNSISYYIPDRYNEGYGVSYQGIDFAEDNGFSLIIALDCGIKAIEKIDYANNKNIDFIICDHHLPGDEIPNAVAVLDPKQENCNYPYKELCGAGVGFKLIHALCLNNAWEESEVFDLIDIAAIAIAADIVPITDENRIISTLGLEKINTAPRPGIEVIFAQSKKENKRVVNSDLVFTAAPRINAAGRMDSGQKAVDLLCSKSIEEANKIASNIEVYNSNRKEEDRKITEEAIQMIEEDDFLKNAKSSVLYQPYWHKGVVGIVASRVIESYYRPTIILTKSGDKVAGSARSVKGYNVYDAIDACSDVITQFGGHKYAAGLTMDEKNINAFREKFEKVVSNTITDEQLNPEISIDAEISIKELQSEQNGGMPKLFRLINQFEPFGPQNMTPVFCLKGVIDNGWGKIVGDNHLKLTITHPEHQEIKVSAIAFNFGHLEGHILTDRKPFDIAFSLEKNEWNGSTSLQLKIRDIKI